MLIKISKQEIKDLQRLGEIIEKTGTCPPLWEDHTEFTIIKNRYKEVVEKILKQTNEKKVS